MTSTGHRGRPGGLLAHRHRRLRHVLHGRRRRRRTQDHYKVTAVGAAGSQGGWTNEANATPLDAPQTVSATLVVQPGNTQVSLSWPAVAGAGGYRVYRSPPNGQNGTQGVSGQEVYDTGAGRNTYLDIGLTNGVTYYYQITAYAGTNNESSRSAEASATTSSSLPLAPALSAVPGGGQAVLSWGAIGGATGYNVFRSLSPGGGDRALRECAERARLHGHGPDERDGVLLPGDGGERVGGERVVERGDGGAAGGAVAGVCVGR